MVNIFDTKPGSIKPDSESDVDTDFEISRHSIEKRFRGPAEGKPSSQKKVLIMLIGLMFVMGVAIEYIGAHRRKLRDELPIPFADKAFARQSTILQVGGEDIAVILENPEITWYEKMFCIGYRKSSFCSSKPLHPLISYYESHYGMEYNKLRQKTGRAPLVETRTPGTSTEKADLKPALLGQ